MAHPREITPAIPTASDRRVAAMMIERRRAQADGRGLVELRADLARAAQDYRPTSTRRLHRAVLELLDALGVES